MMENSPQNSIYFIESHLALLNKEIEVVLESSTKYFKPVRKILEKNIIDKQKQEYTVSVYAVDFNSIELKKRETKENKPSMLKISLKQEKNKFECQFKITLNMDSIIPSVKFSPMKKLFGKEVNPPEQLQLSPLQFYQMANEALTVHEKKDINCPTFLSLKMYGMQLLSKMATFDMTLYYMLYIDIMNGYNLELIKSIFAFFDINKLVKPLNSKDLFTLSEKMELIYKNQPQILDLIQKNFNYDFHTYLFKFFTIHVYLNSTIEVYDNCERILQDLINNPYDKLLLSKLYLYEYSNMYRNIPISDQIKNSLIANIINAVENYQVLLIAFSIIRGYINSDFVRTLSIIVDNYDKIDKVCFQEKIALNIIDFIQQNENDDLSQAQYYLDIITKKKLNNRNKCINFDLKMWDLYFSNLEKNKNFWEFFKSNLIIGSINYNELIESLQYIMKYYNKDFIVFLELIVTNYDKFREIFMMEKKPLIAKDFIVQDKNNSTEKMKEYLDFILPRKLKEQNEIILFDVNIWMYYIFNKFNMEFLTYLEKQLYICSISCKAIADSFEYSSNLRSKNLFQC